MTFFFRNALTRKQGFGACATTHILRGFLKQNRKLFSCKLQQKLQKRVKREKKNIIRCLNK